MLRFTYRGPDDEHAHLVDEQHVVVKAKDQALHELQTRIRNHPMRRAQQAEELKHLSKKEQKKVLKAEEQMTQSYLRQPSRFA